MVLQDDGFSSNEPHILYIRLHTCVCVLSSIVAWMFSCVADHGCCCTTSFLHGLHSDFSTRLLWFCDLSHCFPALLESANWLCLFLRVLSTNSYFVFRSYSILCFACYLVRIIGSCFTHVFISFGMVLFTATIDWVNRRFSWSLRQSPTRNAHAWHIVWSD